MLIALSCLGKLDLLKRLWGKVLIPEMAYQEVLRGGTSSAGGREVKRVVNAGWIDCVRTFQWGGWVVTLVKV